VLLAVVVLADAAILLFPGERRWFRVYLATPRNGCTPLAGLGAVRYTARHRRLLAELRATSRVLREMPDGTSLWHTRYGDYWAPTGDQTHLFVLAELELEPYAAEGVHVAPGDVVLDCGAHVGLFARDALRAGAGLVVAIDPGTAQVACLERNFPAAIAAGRLRVYPKGVWHSAGELLFQDDGSATASLAEAGARQATVRVPVTTIDALVDELGLSRVDFIKMDIEGAEQEALAGAARTLARHRPKLAIAGYHKASDPREIPRVVRTAEARYRVTPGGCRLDLGEMRPLTLFLR
jgi:FkbM family methyltransferase